MRLSFLHVFSCLDNSFFWCWVISHHLHVSQFIYSPIEGYLDCFQILAVISAAAVSIHLLVFVWRQVFNSFGSYKKNMFNIVWNCKLSSKGAVKMKVIQSCPTLFDPMDYSPWNSPGQNKEVILYHYIFLLAMNENSCCSTPSTSFNGIGVTNFGHSNRCIVVFDCCFNFHFPDEWRMMGNIFSYAHLPYVNLL